MFDDTSLMCLVIEDLAEKKHWDYEKTLGEFYRSNVCKRISNKKTGMFTYAPWEIIELFEEERGG